MNAELNTYYLHLFYGEVCSFVVEAPTREQALEIAARYDRAEGNLGTDEFDSYHFYEKGFVSDDKHYEGLEKMAAHLRWKYDEEFDGSRMFLYDVIKSSQQAYKEYMAWKHPNGLTYSDGLPMPLD